MEKPEKYNEIIRKYRNKEITRDEIPEDCLFYLRFNDYLRKHPELKNKSDEEILKARSNSKNNAVIKFKNTLKTMPKDKREKLRENSRNAVKKYRQNLSEEELNELTKQLSNRAILQQKNTSNEEKNRISELISFKNKQWWNSLTEDQIKERNAKIIKTRQTWSEEKKKAISERSRINAINQWNNYSKDEKEDICNKISISRKQWWNSLNEEERKERSDKLKNIWLNMSDEDKLNTKTKIIKSWNNKNDEEKEDIIKRRVIGYKQWWKNLSAEEKEKWSQKSIINLIQYWNNLSEEERNEYSHKQSQSKKDWWNSLDKDTRNKYVERLENDAKNWWKNLSNNDKEKFNLELRSAYSKWYSSLSNEEKNNLIRKTLIAAQGTNKFHQQFEEQFNESNLNNSYYFVSEYPSSNKTSHCWDYGIFNNNNELCMLVDLDGAYYHADICDYDGLHSHEEYDEQRGITVPDGVKNCIINEFNFAKCFDYMCKTLIMNYDEYVELMFKEFRSMPFPQPHYTDSELIRSFELLQRMDCNDKYHQNLSLNTRIGDRLIYHFHHSIWHAHVHGKISPYIAWKDDKLLHEIIQNRIIYQTHLNHNKILQGFNIAKEAPKVSVFSAGRAKMIINKYLSTYNEIFDPFSGFSGRMLGAVSLGKRYIGQDLSEVHVRESNQIIDFLNKYGIKMNVDVQCKDSVAVYGTYECLFTCPPYGNKEEWEDVSTTLKCDDWINICLRNYKCKRYVFVVDETDKYIGNIVDIIYNKNHFNKNKELVILIDGE